MNIIKCIEFVYSIQSKYYLDPLNSHEIPFFQTFVLYLKITVVFVHYKCIQCVARQSLAMKLLMWGLTSLLMDTFTLYTSHSTGRSLLAFRPGIHCLCMHRVIYRIIPLGF